jgi:hypothetical protein
MGRLKHLVILSLVVLVAVFVAAPSALAKKQLTEDEMDLVTAAGQPKIIQSGTGTIFFIDSPVNTLALESGSQSTLAALVLNNIAGEVQIANALNITSSLQSAALTQENTITQSWGATKDWTSSTVAGVTATASAEAESEAICFKCGVQKVGNASASASAVAAQGVVKVLTKYADQIVESVDGDIFVWQNGASTLFLEEGSQTTLAALLVNNIVGLSQVANAVNLQSGLLVFGGAIPGVDNFGTQIHPSITNGAVTQKNTINQFRGTPYSRPAAP